MFENLQNRNEKSEITNNINRKTPITYEIEIVVSKHDFVFRLKMLRFKIVVVTLVRQQMLLEKLRKTIMSTFGVSGISPCKANDTACGLIFDSLCQFLK